MCDGKAWEVLTALTRGVDNSLADDLAALFRVLVSNRDLDFLRLPSYKGQISTYETTIEPWWLMTDHFTWNGSQHSHNVTKETRKSSNNDC